MPDEWRTTRDRQVFLVIFLIFRHSRVSRRWLSEPFGPLRCLDSKIPAVPWSAEKSLDSRLDNNPRQLCPSLFHLCRLTQLIHPPISPVQARLPRPLSKCSQSNSDVLRRVSLTRREVCQQCLVVVRPSLPHKQGRLVTGRERRGRGAHGGWSTYPPSYSHRGGRCEQQEDTVRQPPVPSGTQPGIHLRQLRRIINCARLPVWRTYPRLFFVFTTTKSLF